MRAKAKLTKEQKAAYRDKSFGRSGHRKIFRVFVSEGPDRDSTWQDDVACLEVAAALIFPDELPALAAAIQHQKAMQAELDRRAELRKGK
jgi:hypothetical protein